MQHFISIAVKRTWAALVMAAFFVLGATALAQADAFYRVGTWYVYDNLPPGADKAEETAAEIIVPAQNGRTLVFTNSPGERLEFLDIADPANPRAAGFVELDGEPTSVGVAGALALTAVNTSASYKEPSGHLEVIDIVNRVSLGRCDMGGQPDSIAVSPDGKYLAAAIENERDEDYKDGVIPQSPGGHVVIFDLDPTGMPINCANARKVDLSGLADIAGSDPEPEYVYINDNNEVVATLQENNHLVVIDLPEGEVTSHFSAGSVDLDLVDTKKDKVVSQTDSIRGARREPDAVAWLDNERFVTANEGDYEGGSRGFTIFHKSGKVLYESGAVLEHAAASIGHYPEKRSGKKGVEPEGVSAAVVDGVKLFFVGSERANFIAVYQDNGGDKAPELLQLLSTGVKPEGVVYVPERKLLVVACEEDDAEAKVRSNVMLYAYEFGSPAYPTIKSVNKGETPIAWGALSGLAADPGNTRRLYAVPDSFYKDSRILTIDASARPARIVDELPLIKNGEQASYDLEGVSLAAGGGFWAVSEGKPKDNRDNLLLRVAADGSVTDEIRLPAEVNNQAKRFGFEGVAAVGQGANEKVYVAFQREWKDDPKGFVRIGVYTPKKRSWGFFRYPLDRPESPAGGWVGLSEITSLGNDEFAIVERDNQGGEDARIKRVYVVSTKALTPAPIGQYPPVLRKFFAVDVLPILASFNGVIPDKLEGMAVAPDGAVYYVTDNDGVDDATGETLFFQMGSRCDLF